MVPEQLLQPRGEEQELNQENQLAGEAPPGHCLLVGWNHVPVPATDPLCAALLSAQRGMPYYYYYYYYCPFCCSTYALCTSCNPGSKSNSCLC